MKLPILTLAAAGLSSRLFDGKPTALLRCEEGPE